MSSSHDAELINNGLKLSDGYYERHFKERDEIKRHINIK